MIYLSNLITGNMQHATAQTESPITVRNTHQLHVSLLIKPICLDDTHPPILYRTCMKQSNQ